MQGIVLTSCTSVASLLTTIRANHIPLLKVVTGWGAQWDSANRAQLAATMPDLLIRTVSGDGTRPPPAGETMIFLEPSAVLSELHPWYVARPTIAVELGNEPNAHDASDDAAWTFRYWFLETLQAVRHECPSARIVAPGLIENRQADWWAICRDAFSQADCIGFHAYAYHDFTPVDTGQIQRALQQLAATFPNKGWMLTECGINDPGTPATTKAQRYQQLHAKLPSQVGAACWYHFCEDPLPGDTDQQAYQLPPAALPYLKAGGTL